MARTSTDQVGGEPEWFDMMFGYGIINPRGMIEADPTQFPDENPFLPTDPADPRCGTWGVSGLWADCEMWPIETRPQDAWPDPEPTGTIAGAADDFTSDMDDWEKEVRSALFMLAGAAAFALLAVGLLVTVIVLIVRRVSRKA